MLTLLKLLVWGVGLWRIVLLAALALAWHSAGQSARGQGIDTASVAAPERGSVTNLPVPRYVSLRSSEINVRRGPGRDYRRDWVYRRKGLPVMIVEEYGDWRRIVDADNTGGWVYHALITGARTVLVTASGGVILREDPTSDALPVAEAEAGVVARLEACTVDWCEVEADGYSGWVPKAGIWGVDPGEVLE